MNTMKASIIIPTKNAGALFQQVLHRVLDQETPWPFEVLVIDSGSLDGTAGFVSGIGDPRVRLHAIEPATFGHGRTRNLGISMTTGEYAVLITHDAMPTGRDWLRNLVAHAELDPQVAGVFGRHLAYPSANPFVARELELHFAGFATTPVVWLEDRLRYAQDTGYRQMLHFFSDNNALVRRTVWEKIPYPDVDFAEDQVWAQKIIEAGYKKAYAHNATVYHSHDYSLFERLQRCFDEADALRRLFAYVLCRGLQAFWCSWVALTSRDLSYAFKNGLLWSHASAVLRMPLDNLMRLAGHYLGTRGNKLPAWLNYWLSLDKRMMSGALATGRTRKEGA